MKELLFEIGCEEIPSNLLTEISQTITEKLLQELLRLNLEYEDVSLFSSPRRITVLIKKLASKQKESVVEVTGPPYQAAFDRNGNPTPAAKGFAKAHGVAVSDLEIKETKKGKVVCIRKTIKGKETKELLKEVLPDVITQTKLPKSMNWGVFKTPFIRPIHWILAIYDGEVIPFTINGVDSSNFTYGHRFHSNHKITVTSFEDYKIKVPDSYMIFDQNERKKMILDGISSISDSLNADPIINDELLNSLVNLCEYPSVRKGKFAEKFLDLPEPVLISAMQTHQKYIPLKSKATGKLISSFIFVINKPGNSFDAIISGNERVLKARLYDAMFFYEVDTKYKLDFYVEKLKNRMFIQGLGSVFEKVLRLENLVTKINSILGFDREKLAKRAAHLCKADLQTEMVGEFPELQGVIGREYAIVSGEESEVSEAILEHYLPRYQGDKVAKTKTGIILSLADKIDSITGAFSIGLVPSGNQDPYALRRHALGIIKTVLENKLDFNISELISASIEAYKDMIDEKKREELKKSIKEFILARLKIYLKEMFSADLISAVLESDDENFYQAYLKLMILKDYLTKDEFKNVLIAFKRVMNISKNHTSTSFTSDLFKEEYEFKLYDEVKKIENDFISFIKNKKYVEALDLILVLKPFIDEYFDKILVMCEDEKVKNNRLSFMRYIAQTFHLFCNFNRIQT